MFDTIKIERTASAPRPAKPRGRPSKWRELFGSMKVGDWFVLDKVNYVKVGQSASLYLKGKYSLYRHPESEGQYIFLRKK